MTAIPQLSLFIFFLLFLSAFFSGTEMALTSISNTRLRVLAEEHPFIRPSVDRICRSRYESISAILIGNNLVNVAAGVTGTALATEVFHEHGVALAVAVMSVLIIIFGEVLPKCLAMAKGEQLLITALPVIRVFSLMMKPLIIGMTHFANFISRITGLDLSLKDTLVSKAEIEHMVRIGEASGALLASERRMIDGVISFDEIRVSEIMVPRTRMHMLSSDKTVDEALEYIQKMGDSRMPVYTETPDHINGIVLVKDLLTAVSNGGTDLTVTEVMREPLFVPETMYVPNLFKIMQNVRLHMAVVVDEYGGTAGLVTLEDLLEEIVGEIQDEYDREDLPVIPLPDGTYKVQANLSIEELNQALDTDFECEDVDSLGGLLLDRFGNFPVLGDSIDIDGWNFRISGVGSHSITEVIIRKQDESTEEEHDGKK